MRTKQFIDKSCKKCGAQPAWYYVEEKFTRGACVDCDDAYRAAQWQRFSVRFSFWDPPFKIIDRACTKCNERPAWYTRHASAKDGYRRECVECQRKYRASYYDQPGTRAKQSTYFKSDEFKAKQEAIKSEVFAHYGGICYCCGESDLRFLTLDHKNNDGAAHRKEVRAVGISMYRWARRHGFPPIFQVACFNCNCARQFNNGICPHEEERLRLVA